MVACTVDRFVGFSISPHWFPKKELLIVLFFFWILCLFVFFCVFGNNRQQTTDLTEREKKEKERKKERKRESEWGRAAQQFWIQWETRALAAGECVMELLLAACVAAATFSSLEPFVRIHSLLNAFRLPTATDLRLLISRGREILIKVLDLSTHLSLGLLIRPRDKTKRQDQETRPRDKTKRQDQETRPRDKTKRQDQV
jgi:hypothetical protein